jgi:hypothetical protein
MTENRAVQPSKPQLSAVKAEVDGLVAVCTDRFPLRAAMPSISPHIDRLEFSPERLHLENSSFVYTQLSFMTCEVFQPLSRVIQVSSPKWSGYSISGQQTTWFFAKQSPPVATVQRATVEALLAETKNRCTTGVAG